MQQNLSSKATQITPVAPKNPGQISENLTISTRDKANSTRAIVAPILPVPGQKDALIKSALMLVEWIDDNLDCSRVHFWQGSLLLISLDQVVIALLAGELEIVWTFHLSGSFEEVESRTRELRYQFPIAEEREEAEGEGWLRVLRTGRVRY